MATTHYYRGWNYVDNGAAHHPTTGRWAAWRHGVRMGANNEPLLKRMIDQRIRDEEEARKKREEG